MGNSTPTFADIKRALPTLTGAQRKELALWCQASTGLMAPSTRKAETAKQTRDDNYQALAQDWLADAIGRALVKKGMVRERSVKSHLIAALAGAPKYIETSREIRELLSSKLNQNPTERQLQAIGDIAISTLIRAIETSGPSKEVIDELVRHKVSTETIDRIRRMGSPELSARRLMTNIGRIPGTLDRELPGYMAWGMMTLVVGKR